MKDCYKLLLSCLASILFFFILPNPYSILISFFISSISLSIFYSRNNSFNAYIFLLCLFLILLFPTNFLTLDTSSTYNIIEFATNSRNIINTIGTIICVGFPALLIGLTIASFVSLNFTQGLNLLVKTIVIILFIIAMTFILSYFGYDLFDWQKNSIALWNKIVAFFGGTLNQYSADMNASQSFRMLQLFTTFPVIISLVGIGSSIFFAFKKQGYKEKIMSKLFTTDEIAINKPNDRGTHSNSIQFIIMFAVFIIIVLGLGLYYNIDDILQYKNQLYFSTYSIITVGILIFLAMGIGCYTKNNRNTIVGTIIGIFGLFCFFNLFNQARTFDMLALENPSIVIESILSQTLFVAPMESFLFHIFLPSLVLYIIYQSKKKYDENEIRDNVLRLQIQRDYLVRENEVFRESNSKSKSKKIQKTQTELFKIERDIKRQKRMLDNPIFVQSKKTMSTNNYVAYIVCVIAFQAIFSFFHWFNSTVSIGVFFNSGMFFLYLSSGVWLAYLSYRFGWLTSILVHAFNNSITLILMLIV
jgi:hypothetical protein